MSYEGDIHLGDTIDVKFVTTAAATGAPTTLSGSPVISAYVGNSTTQITAGITLSVDFDGVTGLNNVRVVATGGNGYTAATNIQLVITTGTVGGTSAVGYVVGSFSIDCRGVNQWLGTAVTAATAGIPDVNTKNLGNTSQTGRDIGASVLLSNGTGAGQISLSSGAVLLQATQAGVTIPTVTTVTNQLTAAAIATGVWQDATAGDFTVASSVGKSLYTSGNAPGAASGLALVGSNMGTVSSVTGAVGSVTGAVGSVTGNVGGNVVGSVASVTARVTANTDQLAGQTVTAAAGVTFPASVASPTNITAGTITTTTSVTNGVTLAAAAIDSTALAASGKNAIADSLLDRDMSVGTDSGTEIVRTVRQALRVLRNKVDIPNGKVKKEDDATDSFTFAVTTAAGNPVTVVDPT